MLSISPSRPEPKMCRVFHITRSCGSHCELHYKIDISGCTAMHHAYDGFLSSYHIYLSFGMLSISPSRPEPKTCRVFRITRNCGSHCELHYKIVISGCTAMHHAYDGFLSSYHIYLSFGMFSIGPSRPEPKMCRVFHITWKRL